MGKTKLRYTYILEVQYPNGEHGISQEGCSKYDEAVAFILGRIDHPEKIGDYLFEASTGMKYLIHPVGVRYDAEEMKEFLGNGVLCVSQRD